MDTEQLLKAVKAEIARLQQVADLLEGSSSTPKRRGRGKGKGKGKRKMSAAARAKIATAQRARWAKYHKKHPKKSE